MEYFKSIFISFIIVVLHIVYITGQNFPVFLGQNTPPVPSPQFGRPNPNVSPGYEFLNSRGTWNSPVPNIEPWARGEPQWFFPSTRQQWMGSCQRL